MSEDKPQPILAHLDELRKRIIRVGIALVVTSIIGLVFANPLTNILEEPYRQAAPDNTFQALEAGEEFGVLMRVAFFGGVILASPVILYQIWAFISPALNKRERRWVIPLVTSFVVLFVGGVLFGYWLLPRALEVLLNIFPDVENNLRIGPYYSFVLRLLLAFGIVFQFPVFLYATAAVGAVNSRQLASGRRWAVLIITIAAAAITPTGDPITLAALAVPLYLMYEATLWVIKLTLRR
ncbi:MAG TPA: twin-arginine translocase subunit TatC [Acidimicrobiia bacterium]|nr:twin-arginine translocase subunit TatC [Acidimicrobiia bacterium]